MASRNEMMQALLATEDARNLELARSLHDTVGQNVAALCLGLSSLEKDCDTASGTKLTLQSLQAITQSIGHELHKIALELRPTVLEDHGLARALTTFLEEWALVTKIDVAFDPVPLGALPLPKPIELALFRIVQDAVHWVAKEASAAKLGVILQRQPEAVTAIVEVLGMRGAAGQKTPCSDALASIRHRAALYGGDVALERLSAGGTTIFVSVPLAGGSTPS